MRTYRRFVHRDAGFRIHCDAYEAVTAAIVRQRGVLEAYIRRHPEFGRSFTPVATLPGAPDVAQRMARAGRAAGVGPMAAVAGAMAQLAAEAGLADGVREAVVDNGGDVFLCLTAPARVGLHTGQAELGDHLALLIDPGDTPLGVCSSSGRMGHSTSLGDCDLATVVARDAALADAAATQGANLVRGENDIDRVLERLLSIDGLDGVILVKGGRVGLGGRLPELVNARPGEKPPSGHRTNPNCSTQHKTDGK